MSMTGLTVYHGPNVNTTGVLVKATATKLCGILVSNMTSSARFLKLYNKATAPVVGTDVPLMTIGLPASSVTPTFIPLNPSDSSVEEENGVGFTLGLGVGASTAAADTDTGNPSTGDVVVNLLYR